MPYIVFLLLRKERRDCIDSNDSHPIRKRRRSRTALARLSTEAHDHIYNGKPRERSKLNRTGASAPLEAHDHNYPAQLMLSPNGASLSAVLMSAQSNNQPNEPRKVGRLGGSCRRVENLRAGKIAAANAEDYIPPTFISLPSSPTTPRGEKVAARGTTDYIPATFIAIPTTTTNPPINPLLTHCHYGGSATFTAPVSTSTGDSSNKPNAPRTPRPNGGAAKSAPFATRGQPETAQLAASLAFSPSAPSNKSRASPTSVSAASKTSRDSYISSAACWGGATPPSLPSIERDLAPKCPNKVTGKILPGANPFLSPGSNLPDRGLIRQTASSNLSNASKPSLSSTNSDREAGARSATAEARLATRHLRCGHGTLYANTVEDATKSSEPQFDHKAWRAGNFVLKGYPKSEICGKASPLSHGRVQAWHKTHEIPTWSRNISMPGDGGKAEEGQLAVETFEAAEKSGKKEIHAKLVRQIIDYFEYKMKELTIMLCDDRGKIAEVDWIIQERIDTVDQTNHFYRQLLEPKTVDGGWQDKSQDGVDLLVLAELEVEVKKLRQQNAEMKEKYDLIEGDHKIAIESAKLDKELLRWHAEEEKKNKDKTIKEFEEEIEGREKEIALAGFTSRSKLRKSHHGNLPGDSHSRASSESGKFDDSSSENMSTMSNSSKDSSVLSAKANIHLLEMQYHHSRGQYSLAATEGAKADKYANIHSDPKAALAIKALRASTLALKKNREDGDIEAARRLFEDANFLAQGMKEEKSRKKRREGKIWEDKCHAWLLHLADMEKTRSAAASPGLFREASHGPAKENEDCASRQQVPASTLGDGGMEVMLDRAISMSASHTHIQSPTLLTPTTPSIPGWLSEELEVTNYYRKGGPELNLKDRDRSMSLSSPNHNFK